MQIRETSRRTLSVPARYVTGMGTPVDVTMRDISTGGCCFKDGQRQLRIGTPLQIHIAGSGPYRAAVRWIEGDLVGIKFVLMLEEEEVERFEALEALDGSEPVKPFDLPPITEGQPLRFC